MVEKIEYETCSVCSGWGMIPAPRGDRYQPCPYCGGMGKVGKVRKCVAFPEGTIRVWESSWRELET